MVLYIGINTILAFLEEECKVMHTHLAQCTSYVATNWRTWPIDVTPEISKSTKSPRNTLPQGVIAIGAKNVCRFSSVNHGTFP